jgi:hypothetical protein
MRKVSGGLNHYSDIPTYQVVNRPFEQVKLLMWDKVILDHQQAYRDLLFFGGHAESRKPDHSWGQRCNLPVTTWYLGARLLTISFSLIRRLKRLISALRLYRLLGQFDLIVENVLPTSQQTIGGMKDQR